MFDIPGLIILIVLIAAFSFLTIRARKIKIAILKWVGVVLSGLVALISVALLVLALVGFAKLNQQHDNPVANIHIAGTPSQIARGKQLANLCTNCHTPDNKLPLSGTDAIAKFGFPPLGTLYAPNLTPAGDLKDWSDGEIIRAIREGVDDEGRSLLIMPSNNFRNLSDEDVQALVAYLRSQPATGEPSPENSFNVLGAIFINLSDFRTAQSAVGSIAVPQAGTPEYGKYLVDIIGCRDCHGDKLQGKVDNGLPGPPAGPNLTQIIPQWSEEQFMTFFNTGTMPDGKTVPILTLSSGYSEPRMNWPMVRAATSDDELKAMYNYLHSLPPVYGPTR